MTLRKRVAGPVMMKRRILIICVAGLVLSALGLVLHLRSKDPELVALAGVQAALQHNPSVVFATRCEQERNQTGLTEANFERVWEKVVEPALQGVTLTSKVQSEKLNFPATQGTADVELRLGDGTRFDWAWVSFVTESTPRANVLWSTLTMAWLLEAAKSDPSAYRAGRLSYAGAKLRGLRRDQAFLESLGLKGMVHPTGSMLTWAAIERSFIDQDRDESAYLASKSP